MLICIFVIAKHHNMTAETIERVTSLQSSLAACESRLAERVAEFTAQVGTLEEKVQSVEKDRDVALSTLEKIHVSLSYWFRCCAFC